MNLERHVGEKFKNKNAGVLAQPFISGFVRVTGFPLLQEKLENERRICSLGTIRTFYFKSCKMQRILERIKCSKTKSFIRVTGELH